MRLHCEFSISVARTDLDDYIRHLEIGVGCLLRSIMNTDTTCHISEDGS